MISHSYETAKLEKRVLFRYKKQNIMLKLSLFLAIRNTGWNLYSSSIVVPLERDPDVASLDRIQQGVDAHGPSQGIRQSQPKERSHDDLQTKECPEAVVRVELGSWSIVSDELHVRAWLVYSYRNSVNGSTVLVFHHTAGVTRGSRNYSLNWT